MYLLISYISYSWLNNRYSQANPEIVDASIAKLSPGAREVATKVRFAYFPAPAPDQFPGSNRHFQLRDLVCSDEQDIGAFQAKVRAVNSKIRILLAGAVNYPPISARRNPGRSLGRGQSGARGAQRRGRRCHRTADRLIPRIRQFPALDFLSYVLWSWFCIFFCNMPWISSINKWEWQWHHY